ncbi:MAG TPA: FG-GAP repeat protein, partial [Acidimicrobiia bacterium]
MMRVRATAVAALLLAGTCTMIGAVSLPAAHAIGERHVDFNHDGFDDLVVPAPGESVGSISEAGAITIMYGSAQGLTGNGSVTIDQDTPGVPDFSRPRAEFGYNHAEGDFNHDGFTDLAVSSAETIGATDQAGAVTVFWGSAQGITTAGSVEFTGDSVGVPTAQTPFALFGSALAAGDFDGDGTADLAVSADGAPVGSVQDAGLVTWLRGGAGGLTATGDVVHQGIPGLTGVAETHDEFGWNLAAGDLNGDGRAELVVGTPNESAGTTPNSGEVDILYGQPTGLLPAHSLTYDGPGLYHERFGVNVGIDTSVSPPNLYAYAPRSSYSGEIFRIVPHDTVYPLFHGAGTHPDDQCGWSLAFGNFGGAGGDGIAFGCPGWVNFDGGMVTVRWSQGFRVQQVTQDTTGVPGSSELNDDMGWTMEARDLNGDGWDDLVVGVPYEDAGPIVDAGDF